MILANWPDRLWTALCKMANRHGAARRGLRPRQRRREISIVAAVERLEPLLLLSSVNANPEMFTVSQNDVLSVDVEGGEGLIRSGGVLANDTGFNDAAQAPPGGGTYDCQFDMTAALVSGPSHGMLTLHSNGSFTYVPDPDFVGLDTFFYEATLDNATSQAGVGIFVTNHGSTGGSVGGSTGGSVGGSTGGSVGGSTGGSTGGSSGGNTAPSAYASASDFQIAHDHILDVNYPIATVYDADGDAVTRAITHGVQHGTLDLHADGTFQYTPNALYVGNDTFSLQYTDSHAAVSNELTFTIHVGNSTPYAYANSTAFTVSHDHTLNVTSPVVYAYDMDGDALTQSLISNVAHGTLDLHADGTFQYTPTAGYIGSDSFSLKYVDSLGAASNDVSFTINVGNSTPYAYANNTWFTVAHDHALNVTSPAVYAYDMDGDALTQSLVNNVQHGTLDLHTDGTFQYTPTAGYVGSDSFSLKYLDSLGAASNDVSFTINVGNSTPYAYAYNTWLTVSHDHTLNVTSPVIYAYDSDGDALTQSLVSNVAHGTLDLHTDGTFQYTPAAGYVGVDSFSLKYVDSLGAASNELTFTISVGNSAPSANADSGYLAVNTEELSVSGADGVLSNDADEDGDALKAILVSGTSHGALELHEDGSFKYTRSSEDYYGYDTFQYQVSDGSLLGSIALVQIAVDKVTLQYAGGTGANLADVNATTITHRWVGERVNLDVTVQGPVALPLPKVDWTVPGSKISGYEVGMDIRKLADPTYVQDPNDPAYHPTSLHVIPWNDAADDSKATFNWMSTSPALSPNIVTAVIHIQGRPNVSLSTKFIVEAPLLSVVVEPGVVDYFTEPEHLALMVTAGGEYYNHVAGGFPDNPGIRITAAVLGDAGGIVTFSQFDNSLVNAQFAKAPPPTMVTGQSIGAGNYVIQRNGNEVIFVGNVFKDYPEVAVPLQCAGGGSTVMARCSYANYVGWESPEANAVTVVLRQVNWTWGFDMGTHLFGANEDVWKWDVPTLIPVQFSVVTPPSGPLPEFNAAIIPKDPSPWVVAC